MRLSYHPEFPRDIKKYEAQYREVSPRIASKFRSEVEAAIEAIKISPVQLATS